MKKIRIIYSSVTGNTREVAASVFAFLSSVKTKDRNRKSFKNISSRNEYTLSEYTFLEDILLGDFLTELHDIRFFHDEISEGDITVLCFWCRRSSLDDLSLSFLDGIKGRNIMAIGTMSGDAEGEYGSRVRKNVQRAITEKNNCVGVHLCQGHSDLKRIEPRCHLDPKSPKYVSPKKWKHHLSIQAHPDEYDIQHAVQFVAETLASALASMK